MDQDTYNLKSAGDLTVGQFFAFLLFGPAVLTVMVLLTSPFSWANLILTVSFVGLYSYYLIPKILCNQQ